MTNFKLIYHGDIPSYRAGAKRIIRLAELLKFYHFNAEIVVLIRTRKATIDTVGVESKIEIKKNSKLRAESHWRFFQDVWDYCLFAVRDTKKTDKYIIPGPFSDARLILFILLKIMSRKVVLEINEYPFLNDNLFPSLKRRVLYFLSARLIDGIIVISPNLKNLFLSKGISPQKIIYIPLIFADSSQGNRVVGNVQKNEIFYAGGLTESKDGFKTIVEAIGLINRNHEKNIRLLYTGNLSNSEDRRAINDIIESYDLHDHVVELGVVDDITLEKMYKRSLLGIILKHDNLQNTYCFASKIVDLIRFNIPLILSRNELHSFYFDHNVSCIMLDDNTPEELAKAVVYLYENGTLAASLASNAETIARLRFGYGASSQEIKKLV